MALKGVPIGENVTAEVSEDTLTLRIDLKHRGGRSKSGKTIRVASTEGNKRLPGMAAIVVGFNAYESA